MAENTFLFLGTGGSLGIPVIGCKCRVCQSDDPHNRRLRPGGLITYEGKKFLIDAGPEYREQAVTYGVDTLDGVLITHAHHDHTAGIDDLRIYAKGGGTIPCLLSQETYDDLAIRYSYIFDPQKKPAGLVTKFDLTILGKERGKIDFVGLPLQYFTFEQMGMSVNGYRIKDFAYVSDIRHYPETVFDDLEGVKTLVISALRYEKSHLHFTVDEAIAFSQKIGAVKTYFIHIAHDLDHKETQDKLPKGVYMTYDGMEIPL